MKFHLLLLLIFICTYFSSCAKTEAIEEPTPQETLPKKTNILLFVVDDLGYFDLSITGSQFYETPNIDNLANAGMQFKNAYVSHPRCVPSRYSIQTGKFPARNGTPGALYELSESDMTIGEAFQEADYKTFFAGKWHIGKTEENWPHNKGYDINKGGCHAGAPFNYFFPYNEDANGKATTKSPIVGLEDGVAGEYITDRLTDETVKFIKDHKDQPFFAVLSHYAVHTPFHAKADKIQKYTAKANFMSYSGPDFTQKDGTTKMHQDHPIYAAMIESVDESLGKIVQALKDEGIYENTVIVLTSDHGGLSNRGTTSGRGLATSNLPLRAGKGHVYEGGTKVPFIVCWPNIVAPGSSSDQLTINTDIFPTLLDIAEIPLKSQNHIDGVSILNALKSGANSERTFFWHSPVGRPESTGDENCSGIRIGNYKLIDFYDKNVVELYDLVSDPYETTNLMNSQNELGNSLKEQLDNWKDDINAVIK